MNLRKLDKQYNFSSPTMESFETVVEYSGVNMPNRPHQASDRLLEWQFACMMMAWGLWLMFPGWTTFEAPQYIILASIMDEGVWGAFSFSIGFIRVVALYINGAYFRTPVIRLMCSVMGLIWWFVLIFLFVSTSPENPAAGFSWYPVFAVFEAICCWRSASDAFLSRAFRRPRFS